MAVRFVGIVSPENMRDLEPSFHDKRKAERQKKRMTNYHRPMGSDVRPLPLAKHGEVFTDSEKAYADRVWKEEYLKRGVC